MSGGFKKKDIRSYFCLVFSVWRLALFFEEQPILFLNACNWAGVGSLTQSFNSNWIVPVTTDCWDLPIFNRFTGRSHLHIFKFFFVRFTFYTYTFLFLCFVYLFATFISASCTWPTWPQCIGGLVWALWLYEGLVWLLPGPKLMVFIQVVESHANEPMSTDTTVPVAARFCTLIL